MVLLLLHYLTLVLMLHHRTIIVIVLVFCTRAMVGYIASTSDNNSYRFIFMLR